MVKLKIEFHPDLQYDDGRFISAEVMVIGEGYYNDQNPLDTQDTSSYTPAIKKQCLINWMIGWSDS